MGKGGNKSFAHIDWLIKVSHVSVVKVIQADMCQDSGGAVSTRRIILGWFYAMMMFLKDSELIKVLRGPVFGEILVLIMTQLVAHFPCIIFLSL